MAGPPLDEVAFDRVDGLILLEVFDEEYIANLLKRTSVPVVVVDFEPRKVSCDYAILDNFSASRACTEHLLKLGHRRIAHVGEPPPPQKRFVDPAWQDRRRGWEEALKQAGIAETAALFYPLAGRSSAGVETHLAKALQMPASKRPTAWVCAGTTSRCS